MRAHKQEKKQVMLKDDYGAITVVLYVEKHIMDTKYHNIITSFRTYNYTALFYIQLRNLSKPSLFLASCLCKAQFHRLSLP